MISFSSFCRRMMVTLDIFLKLSKGIATFILYLLINQFNLEYTTALNKPMCFPCASKKSLRVSYIENRQTRYPIKFDRKEIDELERKFKKISGNGKFISKNAFRENMGILGIHSEFGFSNRLFNSFDIDTDGKISFQDFVQYMQILKSGKDKDKAKISFRLIDLKNKNNVSKQDFIDFLTDYFLSWTTITNSIITPEIKEKTDAYVNYVFEKVKFETKSNSFNFKYYSETLFFDKDFTEAFEFITEGVANMFITDKTTDEATILFKVIRSIKQILLFLGAEQEVDARLSASNKFTTTSPIVHKSKAFKETKIEKEEMPKNTFLKAPKFTKQTLLKRQNMMHQEQKSKSKLNRNGSQNSTSSNMHLNSSCPNCFKVELLEKKIDFLMEKLKEIVDSTKNIYDKINQKLYENVSHKKEQTVGNIHQAQSEGTMIFIGDQNWNIVLNMMIGIQMAIRSVRGLQEIIYEEPKDFQLKYYFQLVPRRFGQDNFQRVCSFTDYAPNVFNHIRKIFKIDNEEYINSIGSNKLMTSLMMGKFTSLSGLTSQGKSGSFFYYTADGNYMLKTIHYRQYRHLRTILEDYYDYVKNNPETLITKFFGLHKLVVKTQEGEIIEKIYFVIMANVFNTEEHILERYDIKGSWEGREVKDKNSKATKKDNDFKKRGAIVVKYESRQKLMEIIKKDAEFFRVHQIIDYSLLIGVIKREGLEEEMEMVQEYVNVEEQSMPIYHSETNNQSYIFGIIDILTEYNTRKAAEYYFKRVCIGPGISAVPPDEYAERFVKFINDAVFAKTEYHKEQKDKKTKIMLF